MLIRLHLGWCCPLAAHAACASRHSFAADAEMQTACADRWLQPWGPMLRSVPSEPGAALQGGRPLHKFHHQLSKLRRAKPFEIGFVQGFLEHRGHPGALPKNRIRKLLWMTEYRHRSVALISLNICCATRQTLTWR
jgi:hypothetical protein